ncbi:hypothetical protein TNCV_425701 [Trichonephila clavipes]|nr:hypothetical protein TNCV_425701 [Trichonephila clavipes]
MANDCTATNKRGRNAINIFLYLYNWRKITLFRSYIVSVAHVACPAPTTSNQFATLSTEVHPSVPLPESASNSEPSNTCEIPQGVEQNSKNRRKRTKVQKPEIEIKMAKHKPRKSAPTEYTTDDEDLIMYDVKEELEPDPTDKFAITEYHRNNPDKYICSLTPMRFRKSRR